MILRTPSYYDDFECIADKCTDNCCVGWEIDIDEITAEKYFSIGGEFGERLKSSITMETRLLSLMKREDALFSIRIIYAI